MRACLLLLALAISACGPADDPPGLPPGALAADVDLDSVRARATAEPAGTISLADAIEPEDTTDTGVTPIAELALSKPPVEPSPARAVDRRYAVLVGINDYPGEEDDLPSGLLDVAAMRDVLVETFGYRPENILTLTDRQASRGQIQRAFRMHLAQAGTDGSALFYYSGHGVQIEGNQGRDVELDGRDEAIYVWADAGERGSLVLDDEIGAWAGALAADRVLLVVDACHSGTVSRGDVLQLAPKEVLYKNIEPTLDPPARSDLSEPLSPTHTLLAAARDREIALSGLPGDPSLFTAALTDALREADASLELAYLMRGVRRTVQAQSRQYRSEHTPQFDGRSQTVAGVFGSVDS